MKTAHSSQLPKKCFYFNCPSHTSLQVNGGPSSPELGHIIRKGSYLRSSDSKRIGRFYCISCKRSFSRGSYSSCFRQKKRRLNSSVFTLLNSCVSQRRIALILQTNRKTVVRKLLFLAGEADKNQKKFLRSFESEQSQIMEIQFDEMESFERSKCLPLSIPLVVHPGSRRILGFRVASMPAKGPLAAVSRKKYGPRADHRPRQTSELLSELRSYIHPKAKIMTDQNPKYPNWLKPHFSDATHVAVKGRRGCVVGQGELKKIGFDPLFDLNHTCAMIRANINRLVRRTWCTTKRADRLAAHLAIFVQYHNTVLTKTVSA